MEFDLDEHKLRYESSFVILDTIINEKSAGNSSQVRGRVWESSMTFYSIFQDFLRKNLKTLKF